MPRLGAANANRLSGASRTCVVSCESPVVDDSVVLDAQVVHDDAQIGESGHEGLNYFRNCGSPDCGSAVVDAE